MFKREGNGNIKQLQTIKDLVSIASFDIGDNTQIIVLAHKENET